MSMFANAKNVRMDGGTFHAEGQDANMFDNASKIQATGATFTTGSKSPVDEREAPEKGNGPRMFRKAKDVEFTKITAEARNNSEMFKDIEDLVLHGHESKFMAAGRPCSLPSTEVRETSILTPNLTSSPTAIPRPGLLESKSEPAPTMGVTGVTGIFLEAPSLHHSISNPIPPSHTEAESTFASTMEPSLSAYSRMDEVGNTTAATTAESFSGYSAELDADEAHVNQAPARDWKKFKRFTQKFKKVKDIFGVKRST